MAMTALVTGGGRGIGFGIATELAKNGFNVAICDLGQGEEYAEQLAKLEKETGVKTLYVRCDITDKAQREATLEAIKAKFGVLNIMVNNAGVAPKVRADILDATEESYDFVMNINLKAPYFFTQLIANHMVENKKKDPNYKGCIVNIGSCSAAVASTNRGEYCISKAGVAMVTMLWAARLGEFDIPVYEIRPGVIWTEMTSVVKDKYDKLIAEGLTVQKRWGYPEDIGKVVASFARGDFAYSTGQVIDVDGGMSIRRL